MSTTPLTRPARPERPAVPPPLAPALIDQTHCEIALVLTQIEGLARWLAAPGPQA